MVASSITQKQFSRNFYPHTLHHTNIDPTHALLTSHARGGDISKWTCQMTPLSRSFPVGSRSRVQGPELASPKILASATHFPTVPKITYKFDISLEGHGDKAN